MVLARCRAVVGRLVGRSRFARNLWQVAQANLVAQALPVLAAPLLTRLYTPADFGVLALALSLQGLLLAAGTGRFEWSMPNARSSGMAAALAAWGVMLLLPACVLLGAGLAIEDTPLPFAPGVTLPRWIVWLLPLAVLGAGLQQLLQSWHVRGADLRSVGRAKLAQGVASVAVALLVPLALAIGGPAGLMAGVLAGAWVGVRPLWRGAAGLSSALRRLGTRRLSAAWRRFAAEAGWSTLASVANTASFAVVPLLLARHFGAAEVGWYALMQRVALGPIGLVGSAVSQSFWAEAARLVRSDLPALRGLYLRSLGRLVWVAVPIALAALAGPWYIGPLFGGREWQGAGLVLAASVPMLVGQVVASPLSHLVIHRRQHWQALWDAARVALLALAIEAAGRTGCDLATTVLALSLVMGAMYAVLVLLNLRALRLAQG